MKLVYAVANLTVTNPDALAAYREKAAAALARHGGKVAQASGDLVVLDGEPTLPTATALLSFPDKASAIAWAEDPELAEVHALRRSAGRSDIFVLG